MRFKTILPMVSFLAELRPSGAQAGGGVETGSVNNNTGPRHQQTSCPIHSGIAQSGKSTERWSQIIKRSQIVLFWEDHSWWKCLVVEVGRSECLEQIPLLEINLDVGVRGDEGAEEGLDLLLAPGLEPGPEQAELAAEHLMTVSWTVTVKM